MGERVSHVEPHSAFGAGSVWVWVWVWVWPHLVINSVDAMMPTVRTTVTLDPDVDQIIRRRMRERGLSFKEALNDAIRGAATTGRSAAFRTAVASMGESRVNLNRALQVAADLEDDDLVRKMRAGS